MDSRLPRPSTRNQSQTETDKIPEKRFKTLAIR